MADLVSRINKKVQSERYVAFPDEADRNLPLLKSVIDKTGVWKKTKTEAERLKGVISEQVGRSERRGETDRPMLLSAIRSEPVAEATATPVNTGIAAAAAPANTSPPAANMGLEAPPPEPTAAAATAPVISPEEISVAEQETIVGDTTALEKVNLETLEKEHTDCIKRCNDLQKLINSMKSGEKYDYELLKTAKLIHLLKSIILKPGKEWKTEMINLINIRHDVVDRLSGPSYFEAFFQIAFYLGLFPELSEYTRHFFNKDNIAEDNFLYTKDINASGGREQGISDITFKITKDPDAKEEDNSKYSCGVKPSSKGVEGDITYFISVKRYTKEKSPKYYDIGELYTYIGKKHPNKQFNLCICCRNKDEFLKRMSVSRSDYLTTSIDKLFGFDESKDGTSLLQVFERYRSQVFSCMPRLSDDSYDIDSWIELHLPERVKVLPALSLYFHQELIVKSTMARIDEQLSETNKNNYICIGVLPRGGKSYIAGGIINNMLQKNTANENTANEAIRVLFMTSAISETISQFKQDLIEKFSDFKDFAFIDLRKPERVEPKKHSFIFVSRELLTGKKISKEKDEDSAIKIDNTNFRDIFAKLGYSESEPAPFNLVIFDEAHKGGITKLTKDALYKHISGSPPFILMTATYKKLLDETNGFIHKDKDLFIWGLDDIQLMKQLPARGLKMFVEGEKKGDTIKKFSLFNRYNPVVIEDIIQRKLDNGETLQTIVKPYDNFPTPYFLSATFNPEIREMLKHSREGFDIKEHFELELSSAAQELLKDETKSSEWHNALKNKRQAIAMRTYLTPNDNKEEGVPRIAEKDRVLNRIFSITKESMGVNARPRYGTPFSILMFLPTGGAGSNIGATCRAWGSLLLHNCNYWKDNFIILGLSEFNLNDHSKSVKSKSVVSEKIETEPVIGPAPLSAIAEEVDANLLSSSKQVGGVLYSLSVMRGGGRGDTEFSGGNCLAKETLDGYCSVENIREKDLKSKIVALERAALIEGKGLVILTGQRAAMGISLPCVDLVCMFDDATEADMIIQKMYRSLTDSPGKKYGFIFDFNLRRIFNAKFEYANVINFTKSGSQQSVSEMAADQFDSCLWDRDAWTTKEPAETFNDYMQKIKNQLLGDIESDTLVVYEKSLEKDDLQAVEDESIDPAIASILKKSKDITSKRKGQKQYQAPGANAPPPSTAKKSETDTGDGSDVGGSDVGGSEVGEGEDDSAFEENEQLRVKKLIVHLTKQFVNLLYIRDKDQFGDSRTVRLSDLIKKYDTDKSSTERDSLVSLDSCNDSSNNIYIRLVQDLQSFVPVEKLIKNKDGIPYVGPPTSNKDIDERYKQIPPNTRLEYTLVKSDGSRDISEAIYNQLASKSINTWVTTILKEAKKSSATERKSYNENIFLATKVVLDTGERQSLDDFIKAQPPLEGEDDTHMDTPVHRERHFKNTQQILEYIRNRFGEVDKRNKTLINYTNYLESFMSSLSKKAIPMQRGGGVSSESRLNTILQVIDDHLVPDDVARKQRGEIFTPPNLVRKMLFGESDKGIFGMDTDGIHFVKDMDESKRIGGLPNSVWRNPGLKWLDPASGIGNFPIIAFYKLDFMLKDIGVWGKIDFSNPDERRKHIIEDMLFMIELDRGNNETARGLFKKIHKDAKPNIICGDTLSLSYEDMKKKFGIDEPKFDIIMGNPPYNPPKGDTGSSGNAIWQNFVIKSQLMLNDKGYLVFVHPPGWKKPTEDKFDFKQFESGDHYKHDDKTGKTTVKQIRQGQVWQVLKESKESKESGVFKFIYTNDQRSKALQQEFLPHFPAFDYYVYQKGGLESGCDTKNVFLGQIESSKGVDLNYKLKYLPNLITTETQDILDKVTSKEGKHSEFSRGIDERGITWAGKSIDWIYDSNKSGFQYKKHGIEAFTKSGEAKDTVNVNKVVVNFGGGISAYNVKYISKHDEFGVLDKTMYSNVESDKEGHQLESLFKSDIVKFIFLITQYASGAITQNEPAVANSIAIPPEGITDYYEYFGIEKHKKYIENYLKHYESTQAPKRAAKTEKKPRLTTGRTVSRRVGPTSRRGSRKAPSSKKGGAYSNRTRKVRRFW